MEVEQDLPSTTTAPAADVDANEAPDIRRVVQCVVALGVRHVKLHISTQDNVGKLVELAKAELHKKYPNEKFGSSVVGVHSQRRDQGAPYELPALSTVPLS